MNSQGIFIVFEGIDGTGKSTQVDRLCDALQRAGETVVKSREPTDGPWGKKVRDSAVTGRLPLAEELEAFVLDRREHLETLILPALARGQIVVLDRYFYSTVAYQGARGGNPDDLLARMLEFVAVPDLVFLIDIDPTRAIARVREGRAEIPNEFERESTLTAVREIFGWLAERRPEIRTIDGSQSIDDVFACLVRELLAGPLRAKRCAQVERCDEATCEYRAAGTCAWARLAERLAGD